MLQFLKSQSDRTRKYFQLSTGTIFCIQDEGRGKFGFYECTSEGEPSHPVSMARLFFENEIISEGLIIDLLEALEQAQAALPDAWAAHKDDVNPDTIKQIERAVSLAKEVL